MANVGEIHSELSERLQTEGVDYKGYGIIPKLVMTDPNLELVCKSIYAYLCSYAGGGDTAFPGRDKIVSDLVINKDTYHKYLQLLKDSGYIEVRIERNEQWVHGHNIFVLRRFVEETAAQKDVEPIGSSLKSTVGRQGIVRAGYGTIPKSLMTDRRLSAKAKAIYAYLASFCGAGVVAFPLQKTMLYHLGITKKTLISKMAELTKFGYITVVQQRQEDNRFGRNEYTLEEFPTQPMEVGDDPPDDSFPCGNFSDTKISDSSFSDGKPSDAKSSDGSFSDIINNRPKRNRVNKNTQKKNSLSGEASRLWQLSGPEHSDTELFAYIDRLTEDALVQELSFDLRLDKQGTAEWEDLQRIRNLVRFVAHQLKLSGLRVDGVIQGREAFTRRLVRLGLDEYLFVLHRADEQDIKIKNPRAYYLAGLFNAKDDLEAEMWNDS